MSQTCSFFFWVKSQTCSWTLWDKHQTRNKPAAFGLRFGKSESAEKFRLAWKFWLWLVLWEKWLTLIGKARDAENKGSNVILKITTKLLWFLIKNLCSNFLTNPFSNTLLEMGRQRFLYWLVDCLFKASDSENPSPCTWSFSLVYLDSR